MDDFGALLSRNDYLVLVPRDKKNEESLNESQASTIRLAREGERSCLVSTTRKNAE